MRHQLVRLLRRGVQADRVVDRVLHRERQLAVGAVDRARRGIDEVLDATVAAGLEHVDEADQVRLDVRVRIGQRIAHARLRRQVDHALRAKLGERTFERRPVLERTAHEAEVRVRRELGEARFLQRRVVVVVEVVVAEHVVAAREQALAQGRSDEAGGAGDEDAHDQDRNEGWGLWDRDKPVTDGSWDARVFSESRLSDPGFTTGRRRARAAAPA